MVINTRLIGEDIARRRECKKCGNRFSTTERRKEHNDDLKDRLKKARQTSCKVQDLLETLKHII